MDNIEEMSVEELRQMLVAKDAMVKELEQKMKDMKEDSEASMNKEEEDKEEMMEKEEDKENKLAHTPDHEEKEEKKEYKMSENLNDSVLLSEVQALRENNAKLNERIEAIEAEKREIEKTNAVNTLLNEGKITPSEVDVVGEAWMIQESQPKFWTMFNERPKNSAVPLVEVGHAASGEEINRKTLDAKIWEISKEKSISYSEALTYVQQNQKDYFIKAMEK
jgi:chromosome segregation ATPase